MSEAERVAIVRWLRGESAEWGDCGCPVSQEALDDAADAIEAGAHLEGEGQPLPAPPIAGEG